MTAPLTLAPAVPTDASMRHLLGRLEVIEAAVRHAVDERHRADPNPGDAFRGLYISPAQATDLLGARPARGVPAPGSADLRVSVEAQADEARDSGADIRLRRLARAFGLRELEVDALLIALAPDLDARFERLYGYLHDDVSRRRASVGLAFELTGVSAMAPAARRLLLPGSPLVDSGLLIVEDADRPFLTRSLRVPDRVADHLLGGDGVDPALARMVTSPGRLRTSSLERLAESLAAGVTLAYVREPLGASALLLAAQAVEQSGAPVLVFDLERMETDQDPAALGILLDREARLRDAGVVAGPIDALAVRGASAVRAIAELSCPTVLVGSRGWDPAWSRAVPLVLEAPLLSATQRSVLWRSSIDECLAPGLDPAEATSHFRLSPEQVARACTAARLQAEAAARPVTAADLRAGARAQNCAGLERLTRRTDPSVGFDDLVLPAATLEHLREITARARLQETVVGVWGLGGATARRRGLTALFAGASGTGKTMAAEVIARELGLDLYVIDLSSVVDKYIGETEKNLDRIFAESARVNAVLLFDEADALFGKRSEVSDAHDRYANIETAYLLQRMELFEGIAILATNLRSNLDDAFARRLDEVVDFPEPEQAERRELWDRCIGTAIPRAGDIDLDFLARSFRLSGGNIRNIAVAAAYQAAHADAPLAMRHLVRATQREYRKLGRLCTEAEFGAHIHQLAT